MKWINYEKKALIINLKYAKKITYNKNDDAFRIRITEDAHNDHTIICKDEESWGILTKLLCEFLGNDKTYMNIDSKYCG